MRILLTAVFCVFALTFPVPEAPAQIEIIVEEEPSPEPEQPADDWKAEEERAEKQQKTALATPEPTSEAEVEVEEVEAAAEEPTPTPAVEVVRGSVRMQTVYEAGIRAYQQKDYAKAVRYLEQAAQMEDPHTKFWYYAEAHAMLGVLYQFYYKVPDHRRKAYEHYRKALEIDPKTKTARKYIHRVKP